MEAFIKGELVLAANATESVWKILKVRKVGGVASFKCIRISNPRKGNIENFPGDELIPFHDEMPSYRITRVASTVLGLLLGFGCVWQVWASLGDRDAFRLVFGTWALVPPIWLIAEHALIFPRLGNPRNTDEFRHGQWLAIPFWAGVATLMLVLHATDAIERQSLARSVAPASSSPPPTAKDAPKPVSREIPQPLPLRL